MRALCKKGRPLQVLRILSSTVIPVFSMGLKPAWYHISYTQCRILPFGEKSCSTRQLKWCTFITRHHDYAAVVGIAQLNALVSYILCYALEVFEGTIFCMLSQGRAHLVPPAASRVLVASRSRHVSLIGAKHAQSTTSFHTVRKKIIERLMMVKR